MKRFCFCVCGVFLNEGRNLFAFGGGAGGGGGGTVKCFKMKAEVCFAFRGKTVKCFKMKAGICFASRGEKNYDMF